MSPSAAPHENGRLPITTLKKNSRQGKAFRAGRTGLSQFCSARKLPVPVADSRHTLIALGFPVAHTTERMGRPRNPEIREEDLQGFKYFKQLLPIFEKLHADACARDCAGNRRLHYDQYSALILLYFFNPIVTSLRGIQQASELKKVQRLLGSPRAALGSLSEAARVFDAELLRGIVGELADRLPPLQGNVGLADVRGVLTLVDGSLLPALPRLVEAMWQNERNRAFKMHVHFELLRGVPVRLDLTAGNGNEREVLADAVQPGRTYVIDRGYAKFELFASILAAGSSFVCRVRDNSVFEEIESHPLTPEAVQGGVLRDRIVRFPGAAGVLDHPLRLVEVHCTPRRKASGHTGRGGPEQGEALLIATDLLELPAEVVALIYKHRWAIETFFRFFKHVLGCRHLLSHDINGIRIQVYMGIIACLLIALWTGRKPTLRTYEMICFYFTGMADQEELLAHIAKLAPQV